jgi:hypothetical protein
MMFDLLDGMMLNGAKAVVGHIRSVGTMMHRSVNVRMHGNMMHWSLHMMHHWGLHNTMNGLMHLLHNNMLVGASVISFLSKDGSRFSQGLELMKIGINSMSQTGVLMLDI